ncbi:MAG: TolC family protein [candidate division Zixibacteria bacterium]|nr:TolC family protein [candidate division Zixibacteria bacterium]
MNKRHPIIVSIIAIAAFLFTVSTASGKTYRLAYYEAGDYPFHRALQRELRYELERLAGDSLKIEFAPNGYKTAGWKRAKSREMARELSRDKSIDLILAMGPWTVEDLLNAKCTKPIVALGRFDPILEGLANKSGKPKRKNLTFRTRPNKIATDFAAMQAIGNFKRVGIMYFPSGNETQVVVNRLKEFAERANVQIIIPTSQSSTDKYPFFKVVGELAGKVDAVYLTPLYGLMVDQIAPFLDNLKRAKIAVFSAEGPSVVKRGALASNSVFTVSGVATYHARKVIQILKGARPDNLPTIFSDGRGLTINTETAEKLRIHIPSALLAEAKIVSAAPAAEIEALSLPAVIGMAKQLSPRYQALEFSTLAAWKRVGETRAQYFPHLLASAYARRYDLDPPVNAFSRLSLARQGFEFKLEQPIFDWSLWKNISAQKNNYFAVERETFARQLDFELETFEAFLNVASAIERKSIVESRNELVELAFEIALTGYQLFGGDEGDELDLITWETERAHGNLDASIVRQEMDLAQISLATTIGRTDIGGFIIDKSAFSSEEFGASALLQFMSTELKRTRFGNFMVVEAARVAPEISQARRKLDAKRNLIAANTGKFLPRISASVGYYKDDYFATAPPLATDDQGWLIGAQATLPIFDGGMSIHKRGRMKAEREALEYELDEVSLSVSAIVRQNSAKLAALTDRMAIAIRAKSLAQRAVRTALEKYRDGDARSYEVLRVIENAYAAELTEANLRYEYFRTAQTLWRYIGKGYIERGSAKEAFLIDRIRGFVASGGN